MANSQRYTREIPHRYRLEAQKFKSGYVTLSNRYIDPDSGERENEKIRLSGNGTILSYTIVNIAADDYAHLAPYPVAVIETEEGARLTAMIADTEPEKVKIGAKVKLVFRKIMQEGHSGILNYGYKAVVV